MFRFFSVNFYFFSNILAIFVFGLTSASVAGENSVDTVDLKDGADFFPGVNIEFPFEVALPANYKVASLDGSSEPSIYGEVVWGTSDAIEEAQHLAIQCDDDFNNSGLGFFAVTILNHVGQTGPDDFSIEKPEIQSQFKRQLSEFKSRKLRWGDYPVYAISGYCNGKPLSVLWIGLNLEGYTVRVLYQYSTDPTLWDHEKQVWETFVDETH